MPADYEGSPLAKSETLEPTRVIRVSQMNLSGIAMKFSCFRCLVDHQIRQIEVQLLAVTKK
jgi:hypothetical protein